MFDEPYLRIIGSSPAWISNDEACSSYLFGGTTSGPVLVDLGNGALQSLARQPEANQQFAGVVLSHAHADHSFDLIPLAYDLQFGPRTAWGKLPLYLTQDSLTRLEAIAKALGAAKNHWQDTFDINIYNPGDSFTIGEWEFNTVEVPHFIKTSALSAKVKGYGKITYSADLGVDGMKDLVELANCSQILICEAAIPSICPKDHPARKGHIDPIEAALIAREAKVEQLILTHIPDNYQPELAKEEAIAVTDIPVALAKSGDIYLAKSQTSC